MIKTIRARVLILDAAAPIRRNAVVEIDGDVIAGIRAAHPGDTGPVHDVVLPGLIDAHSHARGIALRRHGIDGGPLERFLIALRAMTPLDPRDEARVAADAALAGGITTMQIIHHSFADAVAYAAQARAIAAGCTEVGVRAFIALALTDQDELAPSTLVARAAGAGTAPLPAPERLTPPEAFPALAHELLGCYGRSEIDAVGPVAPQWCSPRAHRAIAAARRDARIHAHLLESRAQRLAADGDDPLRRLTDAKLLDAGSSFAHGVWLRDRDVEALARAEATIVHCPGSNRRLAVGRCRVRRLLEDGVNVALGIDSYGATEEPDMFAEMRLALATAAELEAPLRPAQVLAMATRGGARALRRDNLAVLAPGAAADIIAIALPDATRARDPVEHVVLRARPADVKTRWVAGTVVEPDGAADARARLQAAIDADALRRATRMADAAQEWHRVQGIWTELAAQTKMERAS